MGQSSTTDEPPGDGSTAGLGARGSGGRGSREIFGLSILFGTIYFIQGIGDPGDGLITQPVLASLKTAGHSDQAITTFAALIALPWSLKPLYGLLTDFVPLFGYYRKSYLILNSLVTSVTLGLLYLFPPPSAAYLGLLGLLLLPTTGIAFSDVVADALMVETGQPRGITGKLQAVQWTALSAAGLLTGIVGGLLAKHGQVHLAYLACGAVACVSLGLSVLSVREARHREPPQGLRAAVRALWEAARSPTVLGIGGFLFLWSFNPFSSAVLYLYMTEAMQLGEQFYGTTQSLISVGYILAGLTYPLYCRRVAMTKLVHLSIILGIASTLAYWAITDKLSAVVVSLVFGFTYMAANLIQLDLAARACPPRIAGTMFALLMAVSNLSVSLATYFGGEWYARGCALWGTQTAFNVLVGVGAAFTAGCWLLWPLLKRNAAVSGQSPS
jgi:MFS family permease